MAKRIKAGELDESAIIQSFKSPELLDTLADTVVSKPDNQPTDEPDEDIPKPEEQPETPREEPKRRRGKSVDYQATFFKNAEEKTRSGKVVYIRKKYHERMMRMLRVIGEDEITLFSYLDNILEHHFNMFQSEIKELYREKNTDDFLNP